MAKRIENRDLFGADLFKKTQEDVRILIKELDSLEKSLVSIATQQQKVLNNQDNTSLKSIQATKTATESLNTAEKQTSIIREQKLKLENRLKISSSSAVKDNVKLTEEIRKQNQANKDNIRETTKSLGAYTNLSARLNRLRKEYKDLALSEGDTTKKSQQLRAEIQKLDTKLKGVDKTVGQSQRNVGNYASAWSRVGGILKGGLGVLGIGAGIAGLGRIMSSTIGIFSSFEKANSGLKAVLDGTDAEMVLLSDDAKRLGAITAFTASEVTSLQTSFARLGFPTEDILLMTESTLNASSAMGSGLEETASLTGATLKAFGLDASQAGRVNDVLAKSTSASALDFAKLNNAMSTIAPVANSFGFSVEGTTALLGQLSNAGFDASSSATATRNILLNLADSNGKLAKSLKEPVTDLPSLVKGLKQLKSEGIDLGEALELTDKRSVAAFSTFLDGADDVLALNAELEQAGGTAQKMADTQLDNLAGATTILNSAWEGFILSLEDGNGAFSRLLRNLVEVATEILSLLTGTEKLNSEMTAHEKTVRKYAKAFISVVKIVASLVVAFVTYKAVTTAINVATKAYTATVRLLRIAKVALSRGIGGATKAMKAFNLASKANPIGLIISLLALAVTAWLAFKDGVSESVDAMNRFNDASERANQNQQDNISERKKGVDEVIKAEELRVRKLIALGGDEKALNTELANFRKATLSKEQVAEEKRLKSGIETSNKRVAINKKELEKIDADIKKQSAQLGKGTSEGADQRILGRISRLQSKRTELVKSNAEFTGLVNGNVKAIRDNILKIDNEIATADVELIETIEDNTKKTKEELEKRAKELDLLRRKLEDLNNNAIEDGFERRSAILKTQADREIKAIKGFSKIEIALRIALQIKLQNDLIKLNEDYNAKRDKLATDSIKDDTERAIRSEQEKSEAIIDSINEAFKNESEEKQRLIDAENKRTQDATTDILAKDADKKLKANIDEINREAEFQKNLFLAKKTGFKTEEEFEKEKTAVFDAIERERINKELALLDGLSDKKSVRRKAELKAQLEDLNKFKDDAEKLKEVFNEAISAIGDFVDDAFEKRLKAIDKQLDAVGKRIDTLRTKANEGQLDAQESLAFEQKREVELERERERTRKRQERAKAFFAVLTAYNQNDGDIGKTITDITALKGLASAFTAYDGVDDTGGRGNVDKKGGKIWTLHPNEQVWSKKDRKAVGFRDREEIKNIVGLYDNGMMNDLMKHDKSQEIISPLSLRLNGLSGNGEIVNKLNQLNQSVKGIEIPNGMVNIDEVRGLINLISRRGNKKTIERSKLHK